MQISIRTCVLRFRRKNGSCENGTRQCVTPFDYARLTTSQDATIRINNNK